MAERLQGSEAVQWYDITIDGKQFNIASRHGEGHIRKVERLLERTVEEMRERVQGKGPTTVALLTALNLADQLLVAEADRNQDVQAIHHRLERLVERLEHALNGNGGTPEGRPWPAHESRD